MDQFLRGVAAAECLVVGLFFLRFFKRSQDRLFFFFSAAFVLLAADRIVLAALREQGRIDDEIPFWIRAVGYLVMIAGIIDKNLSDREGRKE